jgi:hypothetical protein
VQVAAQKYGSPGMQIRGFSLFCWRRRGEFFLVPRYRLTIVVDYLHTKLPIDSFFWQVLMCKIDAMVLSSLSRTSCSILFVLMDEICTRLSQASLVPCALQVFCTPQVTIRLQARAVAHLRQ